MADPTVESPSSMSCYLSCEEKYYFSSILKLRRKREADALRLGSAFHKGLAHYRAAMARGSAPGEGKIEYEAIAHATAGYQDRPAWADPSDWAVECEQVRILLSGHFWRYQNEPIRFEAVEKQFSMPLVNPRTGRRSRRYIIGGQLDGIGVLEDGRLSVVENKTAGEDIGPDSDYWTRLRADHQISVYVLGARLRGYDVKTVTYDVTRKPTIRLKQTETVEEYGERLLNDIAEHPEHYYARREIPRLEDELQRTREELWVIGQKLQHSARVGYVRNVSAMTCRWCQYAKLCLSGVKVDPAYPPDGYETLSTAHPELVGGEEL